MRVQLYITSSPSFNLHKQSNNIEQLMCMRLSEDILSKFLYLMRDTDLTNILLHSKSFINFVNA